MKVSLCWVLVFELQGADAGFGVDETIDECSLLHT